MNIDFDDPKGFNRCGGEKAYLSTSIVIDDASDKTILNALEEQSMSTFHYKHRYRDFVMDYGYNGKL